MKGTKTILIVGLILAAAVAGFYFVWYKPKKDREDAANAAAQAEYDKKLEKDGFLNSKFQDIAVPQGGLAQGAISILQ